MDWPVFVVVVVCMFEKLIALRAQKKIPNTTNDFTKMGLLPIVSKYLMKKNGCGTWTSWVSVVGVIFVRFNERINYNKNLTKQKKNYHYRLHKDPAFPTCT